MIGASNPALPPQPRADDDDPFWDSTEFLGSGTIVSLDDKPGEGLAMRIGFWPDLHEQPSKRTRKGRRAS